MTEPFLGVLMLDTAFPRIPGDAGAPESYPFPVRVARVPGADVPLVVRRGAPPEPVVDGFVAAGRRLEAEGAFGLVTTCGFLIRVQTRLAAAVRVPVMASALCLGPSLCAMLAPRRLGILTADAAALDADALSAAGLAPERVAIAGLQGSALWRGLILAPKADQARAFDAAAVSALAVAQAQALASAAPDLGGFLLECGNLPPYAAAIRRATGLPVWSLLDAAALLRRSVDPAAF